MATDNQGTAERGRLSVAQELESHGVTATDLRQGKIPFLEIQSPSDGRRIHLRVKTRTSGTWQGSIRDGDPDPRAPHPETYWVFVELESASRPGFFVVPDQWMRRNIYDAHQRYLQRHGGARAVTADSTHHAIEPRRVLQWRGRWDLLGITPPA